jgi:hypothetical protein
MHVVHIVHVVHLFWRAHEECKDRPEHSTSNNSASASSWRLPDAIP